LRAHSVGSSHLISRSELGSRFTSDLVTTPPHNLNTWTKSSPEDTPVVFVSEEAAAVSLNSFSVTSSTDSMSELSIVSPFEEYSDEFFLSPYIRHVLIYIDNIYYLIRTNRHGVFIFITSVLASLLVAPELYSS
jgi:hypothetical protein